MKQITQTYFISKKTLKSGQTKYRLGTVLAYMANELKIKELQFCGDPSSHLDTIVSVVPDSSKIGLSLSVRNTSLIEILKPLGAAMDFEYFTKINGIGNATAEELFKRNINTYAELAKTLRHTDIVSHVRTLTRVSIVEVEHMASMEQ